MQIRIDLLGQFRVVVDDRVVPADEWRRSRSAALVKLLALANGHRLHREQAMEALWPEMDPDASAANLRKAVHFARRTLDAPEIIAGDGDVISLAPGADIVIDAEKFEAEAKAALRTGDPAAAAQAADLYGGVLLPDDRYAEWTEEPRERLRQLNARVLRGASLWDRLLEVEPNDEEAQRAVMQAALDAGNRGEVIRQFQRLRERLRVDLGVGPALATIQIYERALAGERTEIPSILDRVRASLAWGIIHLHSGDFTKAEQVAREARLLAIEAGLAREVGEASALFGLAAHMQGRWPDVFRTEFIDWVRESSAFTPTVFDGHLCLAEFSLCGASGHDHIARACRELLGVAQQAGSVPGRALATLVLGEAELFGGELDVAEQLLVEAHQLHEEVADVAGQVIALQRLAEVAIARGQNWRAGRLVEKAFRLSEDNWLAPHLLMRLQALSVEMAGQTPHAAERITEGDRLIAERSMCQPCSMAFRVAAAIALAEAGEVEQASKRLDEAERLAGMWNGGPWVAAVWEARGVVRRAQGNEERAVAMFGEAAAKYAELGRTRDRERSLARVAQATPA